MITLLIDTSLEYVRVALIKDGKLLAGKEENVPNMHSVYATSYIKKVLDEALIDANDIEKIMVVNGPGSFTGVRIGVTIAKTYGYLIKKEVTPLSSLKCMALSKKSNTNIMSLISARRNNYYMGLYNDKYEEIVPEGFYDVNQIMELINKYQPVVVSNEYNVIGNVKLEKVNFDWISIYNYYKDEETINAHKLVPNYLKLPQVLEDDKRN